MLKLPTVQLSRRDAKALIGERIKEGRRSSIEFYEASSKPAERRYATWDRRNYTFLAELFDTDEIAAEYKAVAKFNLTGTYKSPERAKQIIIELKKTRQNLKDKEVGDQLLIDIGRYKARKDCKLLYCFVYDPEGYIRNPTALEEELSSNDGELAVKVVVLPRR